MRVNPVLRLKLVNSLYPGPASATYASSCVDLAEQLGLAQRTEVYTDFLDQDEILRELSSADVVVLPYTTSTESSSAAIRLPLASGTPVLCSDLPLFDEFQDVVHRYPAQMTPRLWRAGSANCLQTRQNSGASPRARLHWSKSCPGKPWRDGSRHWPLRADGRE